MSRNNRIILSIGSNTCQEENMNKAYVKLRALFPTISFSTILWTDPIGIVSDRFMNRLAFFTNNHGLPQIERALKQMERSIGNSKTERKQGIIKIDIDILLFNDQKLHENDWDRYYIKELLKQSPFDL